MSTENKSKINQLLNLQPSGTVLLSSWLTKQGYSLNLQRRYKKSNWLESIGVGALIRHNNKISYEGGIYAIQQQAGLSIHPGGKTALSMLGRAHYLQLSSRKAMIFGGREEKLPRWFLEYDWGIKIDHHSSSFLPPDLALTSIEIRSFTINISSAARAIMECLYLAPNKMELTECFELMEGLNNLIPSKVQLLLEKCTSVKVKRLFLYLAEKASHGWFNDLNIDTIDLGIGKRSLVKNGIYVPKYKLTVPRTMEDNGDQLI